MEQKRKIVIPVPGRPETPQFDAEETLLSARPVVPLQPGQTATQAAAPVPFYKRFGFLTVVVVAAVGIGLLGGLGLARMQSGQKSASPMSAQPAQATTNTQPVTVKTEQAQIPVVPEVKIEEPRADKVSAGDEDRDKTEDAARAKEADEDKNKKADDKKDKADEVKSAPTATRDRSRNANDEEEEDTDADIRARRRERRRRQREDEAVDVPRQIERASERINRIREIFEGRQQP